MTDCINANISHAFYYSSASFASSDEFVNNVSRAFPDALTYELNSETDHPYLKDMQTVERFLHGGGQTYEVRRFFLPKFSPDLEAANLSGWCVMLSYFVESNIPVLSFHYALNDTTTDHLIAIRQSGEHRKYPFSGGEFSCSELAEKISRALGVMSDPCERSFLCEITKFGDYNDIDLIEAEQAARIYSFLTGDEGYSFVPENLIRDRLSHFWGSRKFTRIYAFGPSFLFFNLLNSPSHESYLQRQTIFGTATYGGCDDYFYMGDCPLTVNHGILFSVEFVMMLKALINDVLSFQSSYSKQKFTSYYRRIRATRDFRRKIIMVLEKVGHTEISEIGELSAMLLVSQHISPIVDQVKYLLELLEGDLNLIYSERNNMLVTILTVLGLLLAVWQVILAL